MSHEHFKKSTKEDVLKMLELKKQGLCLEDIARAVKKNHTSVLYWFRKIGPNNIFVDNFEPKNVIIKVDKKEKSPPDYSNCCKVCRAKKKNKRWRNTDYCGLMCWHEENKKLKSNFY